MTITDATKERPKSGWFVGGCLMMIVGIALHLPMLAEAHRMGNRLTGMPLDGAMVVGMVLIVIGVATASYGALPRRVGTRPSPTTAVYEAPDSTPLGAWHAGLIGVLIIGLVIDVMKPATLGFVLPGLSREYGIERSTAALLPLVALIGTTVGSLLWGWLADAYGRRASIILSTILFVSTSVCGAMPSFEWNLAMCFLMGCSAGGMLPVVYTLLAEILPARHRGWLLVLVGGTGLVGGYLAASLTAFLFEPLFGWRVLWLQGFPTGIVLLALSRFIPESPRFLAAQGRSEELEILCQRFGVVATDRIDAPVEHVGGGMTRLTIALSLAALAWSLVNFGLLLWLPSDLQQRGLSASLASGLLARSALLGLPAVMLAAWLYGRWSARGTLVGTILLTVSGLGGLLLPNALLAWQPLAVLVIATVIVGANGTIATLLPYAAQHFPAAVRGRATGLIAGSSKIGGVAVQSFALLGLFPTLGQGALAVLIPTALSAFLVAWVDPRGSNDAARLRWSN